jgi:hypothetical protein
MPEAGMLVSGIAETGMPEVSMPETSIAELPNIRITWGGGGLQTVLIRIVGVVVLLSPHIPLFARSRSHYWGRPVAGRRGGATPREYCPLELIPRLFIPPGASPQINSLLQIPGGSCPPNYLLLGRDLIPCQPAAPPNQNNPSLLRQKMSSCLTGTGLSTLCLSASSSHMGSLKLTAKTSGKT